MLDLAATERELVSGAVWFPVERDVLDVAGPDAVSYLQGQLSQNVEDITVGESRAALLLQPQGRVDAWGRLTRLAADRFWYDVDVGHGDSVVERLRRFLLRVEVTVGVAARTVVALRGPATVELRPDVPDGFAVLDPVWPGVAGFDLVAVDASGAGGAAAGFPGVETGHPDALEVERIALGMPALGAEIDGSTIPAAVGVVEGSVDFAKGCYVGQELVARIDSRGAETPTRLVGVRFGTTPAPAGTQLTVDGDPVATVTSSILSDRWGPIGLAHLKRGRELGPVAAGAGEAELVALPLER